MKNKIFFLLIYLQGISVMIFAQNTSETLNISGHVKNAISLKINDLQQMNVIDGKDFKVIGKGNSIKKEFKTYKGVLLKDLLTKADVQFATPKDRNNLYVVAKATDGYAAIFSYIDIINNPTGENILILFEENGQAIEKDGKFVLVVKNDTLTGMRHVKWLQNIEVLSL